MIAHVSLPYAVNRLFSYNVPDKWQRSIFESQRVMVPFREKKLKGFIVSTEPGENPDLKEIVEPVDILRLLPASLLNLIYWMRDHFIVPYGVLMKYALPDTLSVDDFLVIRSKDVRELQGLTLKKAYERYGKEDIFSLFFSKKIELVDIFHDCPFQSTEEEKREKNPERILYVGSFEKRLKIYLNEIERVIKEGESCLIFVPPFNHSGRLIYDFIKTRYPERVFWFGQETKKKERMQIYFAVRSHTGYVVLSNVIGLFLPVRKLGLVIVERPEDESFIMNTKFSINVADAAIKRSEIERVSLFIGSISPPLSLIHTSKCFTVVREENSLSFSLQTIEEKIRHDETHRLRTLVQALSRAIVKKESVSIFTPRRYYSGRLTCMECKKVLSCPRCGGNLSLSRERIDFFCSECGRSYASEQKCVFCGSPYISLGLVGAELIKEIVEREFPGLKIYLVASESVSQDTLKAIEEKKKEETVVLVGTKLLSFLYRINVENLFLVHWKELKRIWKYRAYEKFFQTVMNLADSLKPKRILLFGSKPEDLEVQYILDPSRFYVEELKKRMDLHFPPFKRLVLIEVTRRDRGKLESTKKLLEDYLKSEGLGCYIFGQTLKRHKKGFLLKIMLSGLSQEAMSKLFGLLDVYGVAIKVDSDVI